MLKSNAFNGSSFIQLFHQDGEEREYRIQKKCQFITQCFKTATEFLGIQFPLLFIYLLIYFSRVWT